MEKPETSQIQLDTSEAHVKTHKFGDVDQTPTSEHHTLGKGPNQAAPGNHSHADVNLEIATIKARLLAAGIP